MAPTASTDVDPKQYDITLYTFGTPNGWKISIALDELQIPYKVVKLDLMGDEQKQEWYLKLNPNGRIPVIVDHKNDDFAVFESGAILLYLAEHYDPNHILLPVDAKEKSSVIQWLMWQMGGLGPMQGQAGHFFRYAKEKVPYAIKRYHDETLRLYSVMERTFASDNREYIAGDKYSLADIACFTWVACHLYSGLNLNDQPLVKQWLYRIAARPAVKSGMDVPDKMNIIENDFQFETNNS
ncbi:hypothetical protein HDU76_013424 [Blyttiomyces sp. JEL0837]|nr:hypothetical protein HDU76_013424 [Blyttiomyces sp. JEL0837]